MLLVKPTPSTRVSVTLKERDTEMSRSKKLKKPVSKKKKAKHSKRHGKKAKGSEAPWEEYKARDHGVSRIILGSSIVCFFMPIWAPFAWAGPQYMNHFSLKLMESLLLTVQQLN
jgi:hypothetical protein